MGTSISSIKMNSNAEFVSIDNSSQNESDFCICTKLESIVFSASITSIPCNLLFGCTSLTSLDIPEKVSNIENTAFQNCTSLVLTVPDTVKTFGTNCFDEIKLILCTPNSACSKYCEANNVPYAYKNMANSSLAVSDVTYTGSALTPEVTVKNGNCKLTKDVDYTITYSNNKSIGTATATVVGKGYFSGTKSVSFQVKAISLDDVTTISIPSISYIGSAYTPKVTATYKEKTLVQDTDYTLSYANNVNVGTGTVTMKGKGIYEGTKTLSFNIAKHYFLSGDTTVEFADETYWYEYKGKPVEPTVIVKCDGKTLVLNKDYTVSYKGNTEIPSSVQEEATVTIAGIGNYDGEVQNWFHIKAPAVTTTVTTTAPKPTTTTKKATTTKKTTTTKTAVTTAKPVTTTKTTAVTTTKPATTSTKVTTTPKIATTAKPTTTTKAVTTTVAVTTTKKATTTTKKNVKNASVPKIPDKAYNGKAICPAVKVKYGKEVLKKNTDYTVSYKYNKAIGKASVVIKGKGKYSGTKTVTFKINPKKQTVKLASYNDAFKASWTKDSQATGYQVMYAKSKSFKGSKTYTVNAKTLSKKIKGKNKTTYYVKIRTYKTIKGKTYYGAWSTAKAVKTK